MALIDVQREVIATCFGPEPGAEQLAALGDARVWGLYRRMVRNRIRTELKTAFRRSYALLGRDVFERMLDSYLQHAPPRTRFFYALPREFADHVLPSLRNQAPPPSMPSHAADLLAYEAALRAVADMPDRVVVGGTAPALRDGAAFGGTAPALRGGPAFELGEFAFEKRPVLAPALQLIALDHAVHKPAARAQDGSYERVPTQLCVYRRAEDKKARLWSLNPVMFALMLRFTAVQEPVQASIQHVAKERRIALDAAFLDGLCTVLADFIERGVILGGY